MQSNTPVQFGKGYYQLTHLISESGKSILRGPATEKRQLTLVSNPKGTPDYMARAILLDTSIQVQNHLLEFYKCEARLAKLIFSKNQRQMITFETHQNVQYAVIDLDLFNIQLTASEQSPKEYFRVALINEKNEVIGHIRFHNRRVNIYSREALIVRGLENTLTTLSINTLADVLIKDPLNVETAIHISCRSFMADSAAPLKTQFIKILCFNQCTTSAQTDILTENCQIQAGTIVHRGYIEATQSVSLISEAAEIHGIIAAKGIKGISIVTLGLQAEKSSHLHASIVSLLVGSPAMKENNMPDFMGEINLYGFLSTKGLTIISNNLMFDQGKTLVQGRITLATVHKIKITHSATFEFNGKLLQQYSQFASFIDGKITISPGLEIYFKSIINPLLTLQINEQRRSRISQKLVHTISKKAKPRREIEIFPAFPDQESHLHKPHDKSQFIPMETEPSPDEDKKLIQMIFSGIEYLSLAANISSSPTVQVQLQSLYTRFFGHIENTSFFESMNVFVNSDILDVHNAVIRTEQGRVALESKSTQIVDSTFIAGEVAVSTETLSFPAQTTNKTILKATGKINIKSKKNSTVPKGTTLQLKSPLVTWECKNFYLRGRIEFQQLSIKSEKLISMIGADIKGKNLNLNAECFFALLTRFNINKTFSVQSVVSTTAFCVILSELYTNNSIINLSSSIYLPSSFNLTGKSILSCFLAATNTLISILQLVLHDPTCQLSLAAIRLGINAGPALLQLFQLAKNINDAAQSPKLERGKFIEIANQAKILCLSLGSLAYGSTGLVDQFAHAPLFQDRFDHSWDNLSSVIGNLTSVTTPLMNIAFPGVQSSSFLNADLDLVFGFSHTKNSLLDLHGGIDATLIYTSNSIGDGVLPGSLNLSPVLSTKTSLYSLSTASESISPIGAHSERTMYKTYVGTGIPPIAEHVSLTANKIDFINNAEQVFQNSALHTDQINLTKGSQLSVIGSSLTVTDQAENIGQLEAQSSQVTIHGLENQGFVQYGQSAVQINTVHNHKDAVTIAVSSDLNESHVQDDFGSAKQIIATKFKSDEWDESGLFAADANSYMDGKKVHLTKDSKVGSRMTDIDISELIDETVDGFYVDFKGTHHAKDSHASRISREHSKNNSEPVAGPFHYENDTHLTATIAPTGNLQYSTDGTLEIKKTKFVSLFPLEISAGILNVNGTNSSTNSLLLTGDQSVTFNHCNLSVNGSLDIQGGDTLVNGGSLEAGGTVKISGKKTTIKEGAEILAVGDIELDSDTQFVSDGKKTVNTHTEKHSGWLGLDKSTKSTTTTEYKNNVIGSRDGKVTVHSGDDIALKGTTIQAQSDITLESEKDIILNPLQGADIVKKDHTNIFQKNTHEQGTESASPCQLITKKAINLSPGGNIYNLGTEFSAVEEVKMTVSDHCKIINSRLILNSYSSESHKGLYLDMTPPLSMNQYLDNLPFVQNTKKIAGAKSTDAKVSTTVKLVTEVVNTANHLLPTIRHDGLTSALEDVFVPDLSVTLKIADNKLRIDDQREGPGSITTSHLVMSGGEADFLEDYGINAESTDFEIGKIVATGAELHHRVDFQENAISYTVTPETIMHPDLSHAGIEHADSHVSQSIWVGDSMNLGDLTWHGKEGDLYGCELNTTSIEGHVNNVKVDSGVNRSKHSSHEASLNSLDNFSFNNSKGMSEEAAITEPLKNENTQKFTIDTLVSHGAKLDKIQASDYQYVPIAETKNNQSWGISGSAHDLLPGNHSSHVFSTWDVRWNDLVLTVPIYHPSAGEEFAKNVTELMQPTSSPAPIKSAPVQSVEIKSAATQSVKPPSSSDNTDYFNAAALYQQSQAISLQIDWSTSNADNENDIIRPGLFLKSLPDLSPDEVVTAYRGAATGMNDAFNNGIDARGTNRNLRAHVFPTGEDFLIDSAFISTSLSRTVAMGFPTITDIDFSNVFEIVTARHGINVSDQLAPQVLTGEISPEDFEIYKHEKEIAFISKIFPHEIKGAWEVTISNENLVDISDILDYSKLFTPEFIDKMSYQHRRTIGEEFIPNPNYIPPSSIQALWSTIKIVGHSLTGIGLALDGMNLFHEFQHSRQTDDYDNTYRAGSKIAGGWAGAWSTGLVFAEEAAIVCAPLTPYGQAACVVGYGLAGSAIGYYTGSTVATKIYDVNRDRSTFKNDFQTLPSLNNAASFFKPSEHLQRQATRVSNIQSGDSISRQIMID